MSFTGSDGFAFSRAIDSHSTSLLAASCSSCIIASGAFGNAASDSGRGGGFARYEWLGGEMSVSGGISGDIERPRNPYGTVMYLMRF